MTRAANALSMSVSGVSRHLMNLESRLVAPFEHIRGETEWRSPFDFVLVPVDEAR